MDSLCPVGAWLEGVVATGVARVAGWFCVCRTYVVCVWNWGSVCSKWVWEGFLGVWGRAFRGFGGCRVYLLGTYLGREERYGKRASCG